MRACKTVVRLTLQYAAVYCVFGICGVLYLLCRFAGALLRDEGGR